MTKTHIITTAQANARPNKKLLETMRHYTDNVVVLPTTGKTGKEQDLHPYFNDFDVEPKKRKLNNNIKLQVLNIRPQQLDPCVGQDRRAMYDSSIVFEGTKQRIKPIATSKLHPKFLTTTGACTEPNYATGEEMSPERRRLASLAHLDHTYGGCVVDVIDNTKYLLRLVRSGKSGKFVDLGWLYDGNKDPEFIGAEHLVVGDRHSGITDPKAKQATLEQILQLKPKELWEHDFGDFHTICHHNEGQIGYFAQYADMFHHWNLEEEMTTHVQDLLELIDAMDGRRINLVYSNHAPGFLERWLRDAKFATEAQNSRFGALLYADMINGKNPMQSGYERIYGGKLPGNVVFLDKYADEQRFGYQMANHGHLGKNGGKGNIRSQEHDSGKSIAGHRHCEEKMREVYTVPCTRVLRLPWMGGGPSTGSHGTCAIYKTGTPQLIRIIDGMWHK